MTREILRIEFKQEDDYDMTPDAEECITEEQRESFGETWWYLRFVAIAHLKLECGYVHKEIVDSMGGIYSLPLGNESYFVDAREQIFEGAKDELEKMGFKSDYIETFRDQFVKNERLEE